ncbi:MAG: hypothetical protein R3C18_07400 [Planctomycetaceae bacterium]
MQLLVEPSGNCRCVYSEAIDVREIGEASIRRGSHVEPMRDGRWTADLSPVHGPLLGPFPTRSEALDAEVEWLLEHWLTPGGEGL